MSQQELEKFIIASEGYSKCAYKDSLGYITVGLGFCIDRQLDVGLSMEESLLILRLRLSKLENELSHYQWFKIADRPRQEALIHLAYNIGLPRLLQFSKMLSFFEKRDYRDAAEELLNSKWAKQVQKSRVDGLYHLITEGKYAV